MSDCKYHYVIAVYREHNDVRVPVNFGDSSSAMLNGKKFGIISDKLNFLFDGL